MDSPVQSLNFGQNILKFKVPKNVLLKINHIIKLNLKN